MRGRARSRRGRGPPPIEHIPHLYYCDPIEGKDLFGRPVPAGVRVDISAVIEEKAAMLTAVRALQLQTVVLRSNRKACMINNTLYQEGETVDGFTIQTISNEGVVVKNGQYRFRLQMSK